MAPMGEDGAAAAAAAGGAGGTGAADGDEDGPPTKEGALGSGGGGYVPPHLRKGGAAGSGERMGGKYERDDLATLRVTNVSPLPGSPRNFGFSRLIHSVYVRPCRFPNSPKRMTYERYSNDSVGLRVCFWQRTGTRSERRGLHLLVFRSGAMLQRRVRRLTAVSVVNPVPFPDLSTFPHPKHDISFSKLTAIAT